MWIHGRRIHNTVFSLSLTIGINVEAKARGTHSPGGEGGGGSIFWKTRDIGLASYSNNLYTGIKDGGRGTVLAKTTLSYIPAENFYGFALISACKCVQIINTAVPTQLSGVGGGYVDKRMVSSYSQNGLNEKNFLCL
jgi:hypothetical protein